MLHRARAVGAAVHCAVTPPLLSKHEVVALLEYACLQVVEKVKGSPSFERPAKNWTKKEFIYNLDLIVKRTHKKGDKLGLMGPWYFTFDNPNNHKVVREDIKSLRPGDQLVKPPRYAPELMQAIEHSHGYTCKAFLSERLMHGLSHWDIQGEWQLLQKMFYRVNTADVVSQTVARVPAAAREIIKARGGRIPRKYR